MGAIRAKSQYLQVVWATLKSVVAVLSITAWAVAAQGQPSEIEASVSYQGEPLRLPNGEHPYLLGRTVMLPLNSVCAKVGIRFKRSRDGRQWTLLRGTDRLDFSTGLASFTFNGARRGMITGPEERGKVLFVPFELLEPISGGGLEVKADFGMARAVSIYFDDRIVRYPPGEMPFMRGSTVFVSVKPTAAAIGGRVDRLGEGFHLTITRAKDKVWYDLGQRMYTFNGAQKSLRTEAIVRGTTVFVPFELFQSFVGDELRSR